MILSPASYVFIDSMSSEESVRLDGFVIGRAEVGRRRAVPQHGLSPPGDVCYHISTADLIADCPIQTPAGPRAMSASESERNTAVQIDRLAPGTWKVLNSCSTQHNRFNRWRISRTTKAVGSQPFLCCSLKHEFKRLGGRSTSLFNLVSAPMARMRRKYHK